MGETGGAKGEGEVGPLEMMTPLLPPAYQEQQIRFFYWGGHKVGRPIGDELRQRYGEC